MQESIHAILRDFLSPQGTQSEQIRSRQAQCDCAYCLFRLFSRHISRAQSFQENHPFIFQARVVLKVLVSLMDRLVACSARISIDTQTHTHTHRQTDKLTTVTLAAHERRGLESTKVQTLGELRIRCQYFEFGFWLVLAKPCGDESH